MKRRDVAELIVLAALWGASFLVMRLAVPAFGPIALAALRVVGAALLLLPWLVWKGQLGFLASHWRAIGAVGLLNSALPFACFAYAALTLSAGVSAVFNSATPLFAALIAWLWLGDRLTRWRVVGLLIGFAGVAWVAAGKPAPAPGHGDADAAALACLLGTLSYGVAPSIAKRYLAGVPSLAVAAGSQLAAALALAVPAWLWWPPLPPAAAAWTAMALLAFVCTGLAYVLYFRLIASAGPANAVSVTYLVPIFALLWGGLFLGERLTGPLLLACAVIFIGTALATGVLRPAVWRRPGHAAVQPETPRR